MEVAALSPSSTITTFNTIPNLSIKLPKAPLQTCNFCPITTQLKPKKKSNSLNLSSISTASSPTRTNAASATSTPSTFTTPTSTTSGHNRHWMVSMETPPQGVNSRPQVIDYYVRTLKGVLGKWVFSFPFTTYTSLSVKKIPRRKSFNFLYPVDKVFG